MSGALIKAGDRRIGTRGLYGLDLRSISDQAQSLLDVAKEKAATIVAEASVRALAEQDLVRQTAHRTGYEEGLAKGAEAGRNAALAEAREQFAKEQTVLKQTLQAMLSGIEARREQLYLAARQDVIVLGVALASRVVSELTQIDPLASLAAMDACMEALDRIRGATDATIRIHPKDEDAIKELCDDLSQTLKNSRSLHIVPDEAVARGGVVVQTNDTTIDASVSSRLDRIADELVNQCRSRLRERGLA